MMDPRAASTGNGCDNERSRFMRRIAEAARQRLEASGAWKIEVEAEQEVRKRSGRRAA